MTVPDRAAVEAAKRLREAHALRAEHGTRDFDFDDDDVDIVLAELERLREREPYMREQIEQLAQLSEERKVRETVYRALAEEHQKRGDKLSAQLAERDARLAEIGEIEMEPGRWRRIRRPDGSLWMETSNHNEAQAEAERTGCPLERLYVGTRSEWRKVEREAECD